MEAEAPSTVKGFSYEFLIYKYQEKMKGVFESDLFQE